MKTLRVLAKSASFQEVYLHVVGDVQQPKLVVIGGIHGDEPEGAQFVGDFLKEVRKISEAINSCIYVIPKYNPDGLVKNERTNSHGVDLNRNFPSLDWSSEFKEPRYYPGKDAGSESETQGLMKLLNHEKPFLLVHVHTWIPQIVYTGTISKPWAEILGKNFGHPVKEDIGYPTPGSLGQYCDQILKIPCVCIELPEKVDRTLAWKMVGPALLEIARCGP